MEDLKQIQEFFSKPLEEVTKSQMLKKAKKGSYPATLVAIENGKVVAQEKVNTPQEAPAAHSVMAKKYPNAKIRLEDNTGKILEENVFVEAFKLEKALKDMGYDVKVKAVDDFGKDVFEIYFNNPADADDSIYYDVKKLGYDNVRVFANPQESLDEYNTGLYYDPAKERNAVKAKQASKSGLEKVRDFIKKVMKEEEITVDDATEFKINLKHLLDKHVVKSEALSDFEEEEANYDELYSDYKYKVNEAKPKKGHGEKISKEVFSKLKGKTINYKGHDYKVVDSDEAVLKIKHLEDGDVTTINLRQFNVSGMIEEILETIELGRQLDEKKLCKKGEAYRKRRMAAGEKSSAYLSGRAVKVCKGQMAGKKK